MNEPRNTKEDVVALLRLLQYVREEATSLGLVETARLVDLPATSCVHEALNLFNVRVDESGAIEDAGAARASN